MADREKIGAIQFLGMNGRPDVSADAVEALEPRPGEDYARHRRIGTRSRPAQIRTVAIDAADPSETYKLVVSTAVTIYDAHGSEYFNCMIEDVTIELVKAVIHAGATKVLTRATWTVRQGDPTEEIP